MTNKYQAFIFDSYSFDNNTKTLSLNYYIDDQIKFSEKYYFDFEFSDFDNAVLDRAVQDLFFIAGVSYYKTYIPPKIVVKSGELDEYQARFYSKTYQKGLGEFWYVNNLDPTTPIVFPVNSKKAKPLKSEGSGLLVALGGGKDSLTTVELLRNREDVVTWNMGSFPEIIKPMVDKIGLDHYYVRREVDKRVYEITDPEALNGHVPFSAIAGAVGVVLAVLSGKCDVVVSNEQSANEETLEYKGVSINHQYSKSQEFERDYQRLLAHNYSGTLRYYSLLRPLSELRVTELFSKIAFEKYKNVFSSCNQGFRRGEKSIFWCGECSKCAFVFLMLTPFVEREKLETLWGGKNLLLDPGLEKTYRQLLGTMGDKPLDCVGEVKESRQAMRLAQEIYPELNKYVFDLPDSYDFRALSTHEMPDDIYPIFVDGIQSI